MRSTMLPPKLHDAVLDWIPPALLRLKRRFTVPPGPLPLPPNPRETAYLDLQTGLPPEQLELRPGLRFTVHPDSRLPFEAFCFRTSEMPKEMDAFIVAARGRRALLDIGALHGVFSLVFTGINPGSTAFAVDPSPLAFAHLLYNLHANPSARVTPVELALSDHVGTIPMAFEWEHAVAQADSASTPSRREIPCQTADRLCADRDFAPDTIKIDVEGCEVRVLRGLRQILAASRPLLFIEVHPERITALGDSLADLVQILEKAHYRLRDLDGMLRSFSDLRAQPTDSRWIVEPL